MTALDILLAAILGVLDIGALLGLGKLHDTYNDIPAWFTATALFSIIVVFWVVIAVLICAVSIN